jgi:2-dehydropantoate 2-reductase
MAEANATSPDWRSSLGTVAIVGAGSLGLAYAAPLAAAGARVIVVARTATARGLLDAGEIRLEGTIERRVPVVATVPARPGVVSVIGDPTQLSPVSVVLFATKGHQLEAAVAEFATSAPEASRDAWFAGMQNGVVKDDVLSAAFGADRTVGAATVLGAQRVEDARVRVAGLGATYFGEFGAGSSVRTTLVRDAFVGAGLPCEIVADVRSLLWSKFAHAVGIFGVSALTGLPTGEIFRRSSLVLAYRSLLEEVEAVARAEGIALGDFPDLPVRTNLAGDPRTMAERVTSTSAISSGRPSFSSMAQDLAEGRVTEVDQIFGDLVRRGRRLGVPTVRAELVNDLVSGLDRRV